MTNFTLNLASLMAAAAFAAGCAGTPTAPGKAGVPPAGLSAGAASSDCRELSAGIAKAENARRAAQEREKDAWKAIVPFAVVARKAGGKADAEKAGKQLEQLRTEYRRQGCDRTDI